MDDFMILNHQNMYDSIHNNPRGTSDNESAQL
jgi:hypothetical protein